MLQSGGSASSACSRPRRRPLLPCLLCAGASLLSLDLLWVNWASVVEDRTRLLTLRHAESDGLPTRSRKGTWRLSRFIDKRKARFVDGKIVLTDEALPSTASVLEDGEEEDMDGFDDEDEEISMDSIMRARRPPGNSKSVERRGDAMSEGDREDGVDGQWGRDRAGEDIDMRERDGDDEDENDDEDEDYGNWLQKQPRQEQLQVLEQRRPKQLRTKNGRALRSAFRVSDSERQERLGSMSKEDAEHAKRQNAKRASPEDRLGIVRNETGKTKSKYKLENWLMPSAKNKVSKNRTRNANEVRLEERLGTGRMKKILKAVVGREYGLPPWERAGDADSWVAPSGKTWEDLGLVTKEGKEVAALLEEFGVTTPNRLQATAIPAIYEGSDIMLTSTTGSGKTIAFLIPLLNQHILQLKPAELHRPEFDLPPAQKAAYKLTARPLLAVICPGRELAQQTHRVIEDLLKPFDHLNATLLVGQDKRSKQDKELKTRQPVIVVGTPGRVMDHCMEGRLVLWDLKAVVLDEIDSFLSMSRKDHVDLMLKMIGLKNKAQRILVSASGLIDDNSADFSKAILRGRWGVIGPTKGLQMPGKVLHCSNGAPDYMKKIKFLQRLYFSKAPEEPSGILVFVANCERARKVAEAMNYEGYPCEHLTGNRSHTARGKAVERMESGECLMLITTDAAMRGLDFKEMSHVVNVDMPYDAVTYAHRAGRVGRQGQRGMVFTLCHGGYINNRLGEMADQLNITIFEANVNQRVMGVDQTRVHEPQPLKTPS